MRKRLVSAATIALATVMAAQTAPPKPLTSLRAVRPFSRNEAAQSLPVAFEATVTYFCAVQKKLFVQDGGEAFVVKTQNDAALHPGDRVAIRGTTTAGLTREITASSIAFIRHDKKPAASAASFNELIRGQFDARLVTVHGSILSDDLEIDPATGERYAFLRLAADGGMIDVYVDNDNPGARNALLDAQVAITGIARNEFNGKRQLTGVILLIQSLRSVKVLKPAAVNPWSLPITPMEQILGAYRVLNHSQRVRVRGTVTYFMPGSAAVLESGAQSLWVQTQSDEPLKIGDQAEATGLPNSSGGFLSLSGAEIRDTNVQAPIAPHPATWQELTSGQRQYDLVSIEGQVVMQVREATQDEYVLHSGSYLFSAIYRHANTAEVGGIAPLREIPVGSTIRLTGVCILNDARAYNHNASFNILLRSPDDIAVVARPPWFNLRHVTLLAGLLLFIVLTIGIRGWFLESRTRRQIGSLAYIEQRRSRILEAINASRPLSQTIEQITELVSCKLGGAPCWCNITDGATLGNRPAKLAPSLRTVERPIASRSGPPLGSIFAAFDARSIPNPLEAETLEKSAELATLAIETSRLYSDLVHRSEFDLLTDAQNRFAMEKALDAMVQNARRAAGIFGLIYIDLNEFKKVNDLHGHLVGDLYLQEAAQRMKRQLRPGDTLARLGGDEFAVLVPSVRNRAEVEEIAARLEDCFSTPFLGEEYALNGSASLGIALYPEDADSADELLSAADAAMYEAKFSRTGRSRAAQV